MGPLCLRMVARLLRSGSSRPVVVIPRSDLRSIPSDRAIGGRDVAEVGCYTLPCAMSARHVHMRNGHGVCAPGMRHAGGAVGLRLAYVCL